MFLVKFSFIVLLVFLSINSVFAEPCCIPDYFPINPLSEGYFLETPVDGNCLHGRFVENCYEGDISNPTFLNLDDSTNTALSYGCCCANRIVLDLGSSQATKLVSYVGCKNDIYSTDFIEKTDFNYVCNPQIDCGAPEPEQNTKTLTFTIKGNYKNQVISNVLGARVIIDNTMNLDVSCSEPGSVSKVLTTGRHSYIVVFNKNNCYDNTPFENITCKGWANAEFIDVVNDENIEVVLECKDEDELCVPDWDFEVGETCFPFGNKDYRYVTVWDNNNCGYDDENKPASYEECEQAYTSETCMVQNQSTLSLDGNELCDKATDTGKLIFKKNSDSVDSLTCADLGYNTLFGTDGKIACTPYCTYDYANCTSPCDDVCSGGLECSCYSCQGHPMCKNSCSNIVPDFLAKGRNFTFVYEEQSTLNVGTETETIVTLTEDGTVLNPITNIFQYYDFVLINKFDELLLPGVKFQIGSKDVTLNWKYDSITCKDEASHLEVFMCEVGAENKCDLQNTFSGAISKDATSYVFEDKLQAGETYCFDVCSRLKSGELVCAYANQYINPDSSEKYPYGVCFKIPNEEFCLNTKQPGRSCTYDTDGKFYSSGCDLYTLKPGNLTNLKVNNEFCPGGCRESNFNSILPSSTGAQCVDAAPCLLCNGLMGFYALSLRNAKVKLPDDSELNCKEDQHYFNNQGISQLSEKYGICYLDETLSIVPQFDSCSVVTSCYDYKSESSCNNDVCYRFTDNNKNDCSWEYLNSELGIGVCKSNTEEIQECTRCDVDSPLGYCNEDVCNLYGDCYYRDVLETPYGNEPTNMFNKLFGEDYVTFPDRKDSSCIAKRDMGCILYDSEKDCVNATGNYQNADVNINYLDETKPIGSLYNVAVLSGNNSLISSDDYFKLGTCMWDTELNYCYKNANGNDETKVLYRDDDLDLKEKDDCNFKGSENILTYHCVIDNQPPETIINWTEDLTAEDLPKYGSNTIAKLNKNILDNIWGQGNSELQNFDFDTGFINTYVSFVKLTNECNICLPIEHQDYVPATKSNPDLFTYCSETCGNIYPDTLIQSINQEYFDNYEGKYLMRYFSQDKARNLEVVKNKEVWIDGRAPNITLVERRDASTALGTTYLTNIELDFTTDEDAICNLTLKIPNSQASFQGQGDIAAQQLNVEGQYNKLTIKYEYLLDGLYKLHLDCYDSYYNHFTKVYDIDIEGDKTIYGSSPKNETYHLPETTILSLKTLYPSECRFYMFNGTYMEFKDMPGRFETHPYDKFIHDVLLGLQPVVGEVTEDTLHKITLADAMTQLGKTLENKSYTFFVGCNKTTGPTAGEIVENDLLDSISFTFDQYPPKTKLFVLSGNDYSEFLPFADTTHYRSTRDFKLILDDAHPKMYTPYGAGKIYYCIYNGGNVLESNYTLNQALPLCGTNGFNVVNANYKPLTISYNQDGCVECYLLYYSQDKGGATEPIVHATPTKIRNVDFNDPNIIIE